MIVWENIWLLGVFTLLIFLVIFFWIKPKIDKAMLEEMEKKEGKA